MRRVRWVTGGVVCVDCYGHRHTHEHIYALARVVPAVGMGRALTLPRTPTGTSVEMVLIANAIRVRGEYVGAFCGARAISAGVLLWDPTSGSHAAVSVEHASQLADQIFAKFYRGLEVESVSRDGC